MVLPSLATLLRRTICVLSSKRTGEGRHRKGTSWPAGSEVAAEVVHAAHLRRIGGSTLLNLDPRASAATATRTGRQRHAHPPCMGQEPSHTRPGDGSPAVLSPPMAVCTPQPRCHHLWRRFTLPLALSVRNPREGGETDGERERGTYRRIREMSRCRYGPMRRSHQHVVRYRAARPDRRHRAWHGLRPAIGRGSPLHRSPDTFDRADARILVVCPGLCLHTVGTPDPSIARPGLRRSRRRAALPGSRWPRASW